MKTSALLSTQSNLLSPPRVDVRLCGSLTRSEVADKYLQQRGSSQEPRGAPCGELTASHLNSIQTPETLKAKTSLYDGLSGIVSQNPSLPRIQSAASQHSPLMYEPPSWSVPARGEARLEVRLMNGLPSKPL